MIWVRICLRGFSSDTCRHKPASICAAAYTQMLAHGHRHGRPSLSGLIGMTGFLKSPSPMLGIEHAHLPTISTHICEQSPPKHICTVTEASLAWQASKLW